MRDTTLNAQISGVSLPGHWRSPSKVESTTTPSVAVAESTTMPSVAVVEDAVMLGSEAAVGKDLNIARAIQYASHHGALITSPSWGDSDVEFPFAGSNSARGESGEYDGSMAVDDQALSPKAAALEAELYYAKLAVGIVSNSWGHSNFSNDRATNVAGHDPSWNIHSTVPSREYNQPYDTSMATPFILGISHEELTTWKEGGVESFLIAEALKTRKS